VGLCSFGRQAGAQLVSQPPEPGTKPMPVMDINLSEPRQFRQRLTGHKAEDPRRPAVKVAKEDLALTHCRESVGKLSRWAATMDAPRVAIHGPRRPNYWPLNGAVLLFALNRMDQCLCVGSDRSICRFFSAVGITTLRLCRIPNPHRSPHRSNVRTARLNTRSFAWKSLKERRLTAK
jgi:hypothetical protein